MAYPVSMRAWANLGVRGRVWAVLAPACLAAATGCQGSAGAASPTSTAASTTQPPVAAAAHVQISPVDGSTRVNPAGRVTVKVVGGTLVHVLVHSTGPPVVGLEASGRTAWRSRWALHPATSYTVRATAIDPTGRRVTTTSSFRTLVPSQTFTTTIFEGQGQTYGVGMPVILRFSQPIVNRRSVEHALQLWTSKPVTGAWYWDGSQTLYFRPRGYWAPHTRVRFVGHLDGVEGAPGVYGVHTLTQNFEIGRSLISVVSTVTHHVRIYLDRKQFAEWPISTGRPGDDTPNGTYLTIEKHNPVDMIGPGYNIEVPWSVRFTWSGDYMHDAYWSVGEQGFTNVSHGCVNLSPADAEIYYNLAFPGDPVTVVGSPRGGAWDNGWTVWFLSWRDLLNGSALHQAVRVGPSGSVFVKPAAIPLSKAKAPLGTSHPGNEAPA
jgi:lipoprotein-anchoring transpeptidase ErfK/SrfK